MELSEDFSDLEGSRERSLSLESRRLESLRNIALPPSCSIIHTFVNTNYKDLGVVFPDDNNNDEDDNDRAISAALRHRFDELPIHKICYYQSYHDNESTMQHLKREINPWTSTPPGQLNPTGKQQDCLGMTPLHILACSTKPTIEMYRLLIDKYPETLIMKDKWGDIPLLYAIWCNATSEVVDLLVASYKSFHPDYEFDWKRMLETMAKRIAPLISIQKLINTQQLVSPDYNYNCDIQGIVLELASLDVNRASVHQSYTPIETFRYLLRISIRKRLDIGR